MNARILIVDDEPINLATMEAFLSADAYDLEFATNGYEACEKAKTLRPDLILLDVMMPKLDGYDVCRAIRADPAIGGVPIVMITALHDRESRLRGLSAGADEFLTKPCLRDEVRARVRTITSLNRFRAIAEQRAKFERLYELTPAAVVLTDAVGNILMANREAEATFSGASGVALRGGNITDYFDAVAAAPLASTIAAALQDQPNRVDQLHRVHEGKPQILTLRSAPVPDDGRQLALLAFEDVTTEVEAREALQRLNSNLEEMVQARTKQLEDANTLLLSYASFVSHDLRSPLTVMKGYLDLLEAEGDRLEAATATRMVGEARKAAYRMADMVTNILQLAHEVHDAGDARRDPLDPTPVLRRLISHVEDLAPNRQTRFVVHELPLVGVSAVLLERVFFNLLTNAAKYSAEREQPVVEIGALAHAEGEVLFVRDNGVGFAARDSDKLFREFSRLSTARNTEGLGLGLSLVARMVRAQGGRIWAESDIGKGATFFVLLPSPTGATTELTPEAARSLA